MEENHSETFANCTLEFEIPTNIAPPNTPEDEEEEPITIPAYYMSPQVQESFRSRGVSISIPGRPQHNQSPVGQNDLSEEGYLDQETGHLISPQALAAIKERDPLLYQEIRPLIVSASKSRSKPRGKTPVDSSANQEDMEEEEMEETNVDVINKEIVPYAHGGNSESQAASTENYSGEQMEQELPEHGTIAQANEPNGNRPGRNETTNNPSGITFGDDETLPPTQDFSLSRSPDLQEIFHAERVTIQVYLPILYHVRSLAALFRQTADIPPRATTLLRELLQGATNGLMDLWLPPAWISEAQGLDGQGQARNSSNQGNQNRRADGGI